MVTLIFRKFYKKYCEWDNKIADNIGIILNDNSEDDRKEYDKCNEFYKNNRSIVMTNRIHGWFSLPVLIIHELLHYIFSLLLFCIPDNFNIMPEVDSGYFRGYVGYDGNWDEECHPLKRLIISISPIFFPVFAVTYSFFNPYFLLLIVYIILSYPYAFPSSIDRGNIKEALTQLKAKNSEKNDNK